MPSDAECDAIVESPTRYKLGAANTAEANDTRTEIRKNMMLAKVGSRRIQ
jgi:hypothetical protein